MFGSHSCLFKNILYSKTKGPCVSDCLVIVTSSILKTLQFVSDSSAKDVVIEEEEESSLKFWQKLDVLQKNAVNTNGYWYTQVSGTIALQSIILN